MELRETIRMMTSDDYQERFKAEYCQLVIRKRKLTTMVSKYMANELTFMPKCSLGLLTAQIAAMDNYIAILRARADIENIDLPPVNW